MNEKKSWIIPILVFVIFILVSLTVVLVLFRDSWFATQTNNQNEKPEEYFCTADAKQCPDGSFVGRDATNDCEFMACPGEEEDSNSGFLEDVDAGDMGFGGNLEWQEFTDGDVTFRAPKEITGLNFVGLDYWPPRVSVLEENYTCKPGSMAARQKTVEKEIQGRTYCIDTWSEGAAGSIYTDYSYTVALDDTRIAKIAFTVRLPQCMNYDSLESEDCTLEEKDFSMDRVVDTIVESLAEPVLKF